MNVENSMSLNSNPDGHASAAASSGDMMAAQALSFEDALRELEIIVDALEAGNVPLEQSIALLRRGLGLADQCDQTIAQAEVTLEQLLATPDGELVTRRLNVDEDGADEKPQDTH